MAITMQGSWTITVTRKSAAYDQRFTIQGSDDADGSYAGVVGGDPVFVTGAQWTVTVEHQPSGSAEWLPSDERLSTPVRAGGQIVFDIQSNDSGPDEDYNDLVLTCSMPESASEYVLYGKVRTYSRSCILNPCFRDYVVIDTLSHLQAAVNYPAVRAALQALYPERLRRLSKQPLPGPMPEPGPPPFRPMMIPLGRGAGREAETSGQLRSQLLLGRAEIGAAASAALAPYVQDLGKLIDDLRLPCLVEEQPGLLLRFLEYDRTAAELAGGAYSGEGDRQVLGLTVTDEQGNYVFRFSHTLVDIAEEMGDIEPGGPDVAIQLRPDIIVQVVSGIGEEAGVLFETALKENVPNLRRINLCIPEEAINPGPSACQGGRAIQAIGNIWTLSGVGNTLDVEGRITATNPTGPQITRGAWVGTLDMFACFLDHPEVKYYTIRQRRPGGAWSYVFEPYTHIKISEIGTPGYKGTKVGPFFDRPGSLSGVPAYDNIESDPAWTATHRLRKIQLTSSSYAPNSDPGTVRFEIRGYDSDGNLVAGTSDTISLYIDNRPVDGDIASITMGGFPPEECALFELPAANEPLTVRFKVDHPGGFLKNYALKVFRGSAVPVAVSDTTPPAQPLSLAYDEGTHGSFFFGTFNAVGPDGDRYVLAELQPDSGAWLPAGKEFCAFAFEVHAQPRTTDGYSLGVSRRLDLELVGISYTPTP